MMSNLGDDHHLPEADHLSPHTSTDLMGHAHHMIPDLHAGGNSLPEQQIHPLFTDGLGSSSVQPSLGDHPLFQDHKSQTPSPSDISTGAHGEAHHSNLTFGTGYYENSPVSGEKLYHCPDGHVYDLNGNKVR